MRMQNLSGKTALITGGSKGIGLGIGESLIRLGMNVALTSRSQRAADEAAALLNGIGPGRAIGIEADVIDLSVQEASVAKVQNIWGKLDVLVANAGVGHFAPIDEMTTDQWQQTIDINLTGVFNSVKASIPALKESKGYIITIASLAGTNFFARGAAYNASKFGLVGFTTSHYVGFTAFRNQSIYGYARFGIHFFQQPPTF